MAFSGAVWEVKTSGDDTNNGGGFNTGSTFATDGKVTNGTTSSATFSSASYTFVSADVGHFVFIKSGTNWLPGWYLITAISSGSAVIDCTAGHVVRYVVTGYIAQGLRRTTGCVNSSYVSGTASGTWGVDYSQKSDGTPIISFSDMVIGATTTQFTSVGKPVGKNYIGNVISVTAGTGFTVQRVAITSTSGTTATCDKSLGTAGSTGGTGKMGGALASIGLAGSVASALPGAVFVYTGSYSITSATTNISGGVWSSTGVSAIRLEGYATWRGDLGTAPILTASGIASVNIVRITGSASCRLANLTLDGANLTGMAGAWHSANVEKVAVQNMKGGAFLAQQANITYVNCSGTGCSSTAVFERVAGGQGFAYIGCTAYSNSIQAFSRHSSSTLVYCIAANNTGSGSFGFDGGTNGSFYLHCTAYGNGADGFTNASVGAASYYYNCIAEGNGGYGFDTPTGLSATTVALFNCATYNNTSGPYFVGNTTVGAYNHVAYTSTAFVNAGSNNLALNQNATGGALLRGAARWGAFPLIPTTAVNDIGAVQAGWATAVYGEQSHTFVQ
jgi:hypothetical protein